MEANEILNNEELIDVTDEVIKTPPVESNSVVGKLVVGIGVLGVAGVAVLLYKKHKRKEQIFIFLILLMIYTILTDISKPKRS